MARAMVFPITITNPDLPTQNLTPVAPPLPGILADWDATVFGADSSVISSWVSNDGAKTLTVPAGSTGPAVTTELGRKHVYFDGASSEALSIPLARSQPHSIAIWVRWATTPVSGTFVVGDTASGGSNLSLNASLAFSANAGTTFSHTTVASTSWQAVVVVFNGSSSSINVGGTIINGAAGSNPASGIVLGTGPSAPAHTRYAVRRVMVFGKALSPTEQAAAISALTA